MEDDIKWEDYIVEEEIDADELLDELPIEPIPFAGLERDMRHEIEELLEANINEFMIHKNYIPEGKELQKSTIGYSRKPTKPFYASHSR